MKAANPGADSLNISIIRLINYPVKVKRCDNQPLNLRIAHNVILQEGHPQRQGEYDRVSFFWVGVSVPGILFYFLDGIAGGDPLEGSRYGLTDEALDPLLDCFFGGESS